MKLMWAEFKDIVSKYDKQLKGIRYVDLGNVYSIWIELGGKVFECDVYKDTQDAVEFETYYKAYVKSEYIEGGKYVSSSLPVVFGNTIWRGDENGIELKFLITAGVENFFDIQITKTKCLRGGRYIIMNPEDVHEDDYIEFSIIDKDNVLGLFQIYGVPEGGFLELTKFVKKWWVYKTPTWEFKSESYNKILQGLYFRIGYNSHGTVDIRLKGTLQWIENTC